MHLCEILMRMDFTLQMRTVRIEGLGAPAGSGSPQTPVSQLGRGLLTSLSCF